MTGVRFITVAGSVLLMAAVGACGGGSPEGLPAPGSDDYRETVRAFYRGLASVEVGLLEDARTQFTAAAGLAPAEPAIAANLAVAHVGFGDDAAAVEQLELARSLAPESSAIAFLQGQLAGFRGLFEDAVAYYREAADLDVGNLKARFALAQELERTGEAADALEAQELYQAILAAQPDNLTVLVAMVRLAAGRGDAAVVADAVERLASLSATWPSIAQEQLRRLETAVAGGDLSQATTAAALLRNVLVRVTAYLESQAAVSVSAELVAEPLPRFLRLPSPSPLAAPADETLTFTVEAIDMPGERAVRGITGGVLTHEAERPTLFVAHDDELQRLDADGGATLPWPGTGPAVSPTTAPRLRTLDWNGDFRMDLAVSDAQGLGLLQQTEDGTFQAAPLVSPDGEELDLGSAAGVWPADLEMDGDLDIVVAVTGPPLVLRNNGDGRWLTLEPFPGIEDLRDFGWGDLDQDGDPDPVLLDAAGQLHLFVNQQAGLFVPWVRPDVGEGVVGLALGDLDADSRLDLVVLDTEGTLVGLTWDDANEEWVTSPAAEWDRFPGDTTAGSHRLLLADLDNNGALDLTASGAAGTRVWLSDEASTLSPFDARLDAELFEVVDLNGDGWLDFLGLEAGSPVRALGRGTAGYRWQEIRPRAQLAAGDQRINSFGVGGEIEARSGLLVQKQILSGASVHLGLGEHPQVDVTRISWPNGVTQADFDFAAGQVVVAEQRLKGSCPWLFTYDGSGMQFVTDFLWRSPLGLRINAQDTAGVTQTEDWVLIRGDQLIARDGEYDVRITAELWETHFFDTVQLMVVDHPAESEVFVDERFARSPVEHTVRVTAAPRSVRHAWDDSGGEVTRLVQARDGQYVASVERGRYQGVTRDHFVEVELDLSDVPPETDMLWLLAHGWVYPTDSSINVAMGQGDHPTPRGVALDVEDQHGQWTRVEPDLGFPAGKNKTMVIPLRRRADGEFPVRLRLQTNLEVYWDWIAHAVPLSARPGGSDTAIETVTLPADTATLAYRGFSRTDFVGPRGLEIPRYEIANTRPRWRDLEGYHTRFGDVRELLTDVDDRYVIVNAGDEIRLRFQAPAAPRPGWTRDYVLIGDGWVKDGDFNTTHSKTVGPLPSHDQPAYDPQAPADLEKDPVYQRFSDDWQAYHTRFVSPRPFLRGLVRVRP